MLGGLNDKIFPTAVWCFSDVGGLRGCGLIGGSLSLGAGFEVSSLKLEV